MKAFRKKIEDERGRRQSERKACLGVEFVIPSETQKPLMMRCDGNVSKGVFDVSFHYDSTFAL